MAFLQPANAVVRRVRSQIQDRGAQVWDDGEVLEAIDSCFAEIEDTRRQAGQDHGLDLIDFTTAGFGARGPTWRDLELPEYILEVRRVDGLQSPGAQPDRFPEGSIDQLDGALGCPHWAYTEGQQRISIFGSDLSGYQYVRVWFIRRSPPLHWGVAGTTGGIGVVRLDQDEATRKGELIRRPGAYVGSKLMIDGQILTVLRHNGVDAEIGEVSYPTLGEHQPGSTGSGGGGSGGPGIGIFIDPEPGIGLATQGSSTPSLGTNQVLDGKAYVMMVPIAPEHIEFLVQKCAFWLMTRAGNTEYLDAASQALFNLEERFRSSMSNRSSQAPKRMWSSRG